jgi:hypothetical protein
MVKITEEEEIVENSKEEGEVEALTVNQEEEEA